MELEPGQLRISPMPKTWILDLDGTLLVHDGLVTAYAVNTVRDRFCKTEFVTDSSMGTRFD